MVALLDAYLRRYPFNEGEPMVRWMRAWWNGKDVRVDPDEPDTVGGLGQIHQYRTVRHWTAELAHRLARWHAKNWDKLWTLAISAMSLLISIVALSRTG